ncbi:MAG: hypothetical protein II556_02900 [Bacteroidales bacterium]|nr:hypothetical protein [Bacteroidales bacterium]
MTTFHESFKIDLKYMNALVDLVSLCRKKGIRIREFGTLNNGLQVKFDGFDGDAVIHDFSYGHELGEWETYKMPWDDDDVSVHTSEELASLLEKESDKKSSEDPFIASYLKLNALLKASAARDIEIEKELYE